MMLRDVTNGPDWMMWVVFAMIAVMSIVLITGHGAWLIAGYNTATKEEKSKYNEKKLCRVTGIGMALIAVCILIMAIGIEVLPAYFSNVFLAIVLADVIVMIILMNTICKR